MLAIEKNRVDGHSEIKKKVKKKYRFIGYSEIKVGIIEKNRVICCSEIEEGMEDAKGATFDISFFYWEIIKSNLI